MTLEQLVKETILLFRRYRYRRTVQFIGRAHDDEYIITITPITYSEAEMKITGKSDCGLTVKTQLIHPLRMRKAG